MRSGGPISRDGLLLLYRLILGLKKINFIITIIYTIACNLIHSVRDWCGLVANVVK